MQATTDSPTKNFDAFQNREYFPALDGVRAFCVLGVIACHMADTKWWSWLSGGLGVNVFFVLSGFLITTLAVREERKKGRVSLGAFYVRRTMRIFPLYYFALGVYAALIYLTSWSASLRENFTSALPSYLLYFQEVPFARDVIAAGRASPFAHSWTLGIEEKFYLVWPLIGFVVCRNRASFRLAIAVALCILLATTQSVNRLGAPVSEWSLNFLLFPYSQILCGCVLALVLDRPEGFRRLQALGSPIGTALTLVVFALLQLAYHPYAQAIPEIVLLHTLAATALVGCLVLGENRLTRFLGSRPLLFLGRLSYGMYLFHALGISVAQKVIKSGSGNFATAMLTFVLAAGMSALIAYILSGLIEKPCVKWGRRWANRIANPVAPNAKTTPESSGIPHEPARGQTILAPLAP